MKNIILPWVILFLAACQSKPTVMFAPPPAGRVAAVSKNVSPGSMAIGSADQLRQSETVKAYGINRYVDPADSRLVHERHAIYRLEQHPAWITRSPHNQKEVLLGPVVGLSKPEFAPEPLPGETSREIFQARRGIQEANEGMKDLRESQEKLANGFEAMAKNTAEAERKLTAVVSVLNERVRHLEGDSSTSRDEQTPVRKTELGDGDVTVRSPNP
jgi:hypothetical protein